MTVEPQDKTTRAAYKNWRERQRKAVTPAYKKYCQTQMVRFCRQLVYPTPGEIYLAGLPLPEDKE